MSTGRWHNSACCCRADRPSAHRTASVGPLAAEARVRKQCDSRVTSADDVFFQLDSNRFRRFDAAKDPLPVHDGDIYTPSTLQAEATKSPESESHFTYEHDLRDFLARNLHLNQSGLSLYEQEGVTGVEFPAGGRFIDILAVDAKGGLVVIELKVSKGYHRVVGQLLRYVGWIERHHAEPNQLVRGIIVAKLISEDLKLACSRLRDVHLVEYALAVTLKRVV